MLPKIFKTFPVQYFLEARGGSQTERVIAVTLGVEGPSHQKCSDGKFHYLYECNHTMMEHFDRSRQDQNLNFAIWYFDVRTQSIKRWRLTEKDKIRIRKHRVLKTLVTADRLPTYGRPRARMDS